MAHKIAHTMVDLSLQENTEQKEYMKANSTSTILPQVLSF
jgi:glutaredoxin